MREEKNELEKIGLYKEVKKFGLFTPYNPNNRPEILNEIENKNIELPSNREKIKAYFLQMISDEVALNEGVENKKNEAKEENLPPQEQVVRNFEKVKSTIIQQSLLLNKNESELLKETSFESDNQENLVPKKRYKLKKV